MDELVKLIVEKEKLIQLKDKELKEMQDKVLCSYAEIENIIERTKREAENSRKFSIQVCPDSFDYSHAVTLCRFMYIWF